MGLTGLSFYPVVVYVVQRHDIRFSPCRSWIRIPVEPGISRPNPQKYSFQIKKLIRKPQMTRNNPESTRITFFGQNRGKPLFPAKIDQDRLFRSKTSFSSQNRPKRLFSAKIDQTQFFGQNRPKPVFSVKIDQNHFFLAAIDQNQFVWSKPVFQ